jgi:hypothetical protein
VAWALAAIFLVIGIGEFAISGREWSALLETNLPTCFLALLRSPAVGWRTGLAAKPTNSLITHYPLCGMGKCCKSGPKPDLAT